jgi:TPR repeat protein
MAVGVVQALRLTVQGEASRTALFRMLKAMAFTFPIAFIAMAAWDGWRVLHGLLGVAQGRPLDQRAMGLLRANGEGLLTKDPAKAAAWFKRSAEGGDAEGQLLFAKALRTGQGTPRDPDGALHWAQASANQGQPDAMVLAGDWLRASDHEAAKAWYQRALPIYLQRIQTWDADACLSYGRMLYEGKGIAMDRVEGLAWMYISRRIGLDPWRTILVQVSEGSLADAQRTQAAKRAAAILDDQLKRDPRYKLKAVGVSRP